MPRTLVATSLSVDRGGHRIIRDVGFQVRSGTALLLTGPNGSGKTTLIRAIAGFLAPAAGSIALEGGDGELDLGQQCHYVGHLNAVKVNLTVLENLRFWATFLNSGPPQGSVGASTPDRVGAALDAFGLTALAGIAAGFLSAGQRRRVGLARLLVADRPVWLLDEPTVSLDATNTALLAKAVTDHCANGGIAVAATHLPLGLADATEMRLGVATEAGAP